MKNLFKLIIVVFLFSQNLVYGQSCGYIGGGPTVSQNVIDWSSTSTATDESISEAIANAFNVSDTTGAENLAQELSYTDSIAFSNCNYGRPVKVTIPWDKVDEDGYWWSDGYGSYVFMQKRSGSGNIIFQEEIELFEGLWKSIAVYQKSNTNACYNVSCVRFSGNYSTTLATNPSIANDNYVVLTTNIDTGLISPNAYYLISNWEDIPTDCDILIYWITNGYD
jgi:hypothetical protein